MRSFIIITVLSALAACYGDAVHSAVQEMSPDFAEAQAMTEVIYTDAESSRNGKQDDEVLIYEKNYSVPAIHNMIQHLGFTYLVDPKYEITKVLRTLYLPTPASINTVATRTTVEIEMQSNIGATMSARFEVYGREIAP